MITKKGTVSSAKMTGTVTVTVHAFVFHPIYKKRFRRSKKFLADVNGHDVQEGDLVIITECRPLSKNKCFKVTEVVEQAPRVSDVKEEAAIEETVHREKVAPVIEKKEKKEIEETEESKETEEKSSESSDTSASSDSSKEKKDDEKTSDDSSAEA